MASISWSYPLMVAVRPAIWSTRGERAGLRAAGMKAAPFLAKASAPQLGSRSPCDFTTLRTWLISRVGAREAGQQSCVDAVALALVAIDKRHLARVSDDHLVPHFREGEAHPGRV